MKNPLTQFAKKPNDEEIKREAEELIAAFNQVANTDAGIRVLKWLLLKTGYHMLSVDWDSDKRIVAENTSYNEGRRSIWIQLREFLNYESKIKVELEPPKVKHVSSEEE